MKIFKLFLSVILLTTLTLTSCSSDDNNDSSSTNSLVGKWTYEKEEALDANGKVVSTYIPSSYQFCQKDFLEFKDNGEYVGTQYDYISNKCTEYVSVIGTWKLEGNILTVTTVDGSYTDTYKETVSFSGDMAIFEAPLSRENAEDYELNVVKLRTILKKM